MPLLREGRLRLHWLPQWFLMSAAIPLPFVDGIFMDGIEGGPGTPGLVTGAFAHC